MKYIRTIDGHIYETTGQGKNHPRYYNIVNANLEIDALGIVKQADTIEELCDLFVDTTGLKGIADGWRFDGYDKSKKALWWISTSETTRYIPISEWNDKTAIKGAIWTDKGLIYVAKMNDKGELELL